MTPTPTSEELLRYLLAAVRHAGGRLSISIGEAESYEPGESIAVLPDPERRSITLIASQPGAKIHFIPCPTPSTQPQPTVQPPQTVTNAVPLPTPPVPFRSVMRTDADLIRLEQEMHRRQTAAAVIAGGNDPADTLKARQ